MWQSIDNVPKDGSQFLAFDVVTKTMDVCYWSKNYGSVEPVQSDGEYGPSIGDFKGDWIDEAGNRIDSKITHWMPLPEEPK